MTPHSAGSPWAVKVIENRKWKTDYRGVVLIHASLKRPNPRLYKYAADLAAEAGHKIPAVADFQYGGIIGAATLVDCVQERDPYPAKAPHDRMNLFFEGPYGFVFHRPIKFPKIVEETGRLGLCKVSPELARKVSKYLTR